MKEKDIKVLWGRPAGRCSMPDCRKLLCPYPQPGSVLGEMAHIVAESPNGPRGAYNISQEKRDSYANLILLCPEHHIIIDDHPDIWTVDKLMTLKMEHEQWVEQQFQKGTIKLESEGLLKKLDRLFERQKIMNFLLFANIGNARFLQALQDSNNALWFNLNAGKDFRDNYLDFLDENFANSSSVPFMFDMLDVSVAFPEGYESYADHFRNAKLEKPNCPILIQNVEIVKDGNRYFCEGGERIPVPFLPLHNGYIWGRDESTALPNKVHEEPCNDYWGAYFWIRPNGLRIVVGGIGVLDPMECMNGTAIWYSTEDARSFLGVRPAMIATDERKQAMNEAVKISYIEEITKFTEKRREHNKSVQ